MKSDIAEYLALIVLGTIAVVAMFQLHVGGKEIVLSIGSGLIGYLTKSATNGRNTGPPEKPEKAKPLHP